MMGRHAGMLWAAVVLVGAGCASTGPVAPLVPLPESDSPKPSDMVYRAWRVVVTESAGPNPALTHAFAAELKGQLQRYGIECLSSDEDANRLLERMMTLQLQGQGETSVRDMAYELSHADGVVSVSIDSLSIVKNNEAYRWTDKKGKAYVSFTSEVLASGHLTLALPRTGGSRSVQFSNNATAVTYERVHQFSPEAMGLDAVRRAARTGRVMEPLYSEFPLLGYVVDAGDEARCVVINRGSQHGVAAGRLWDLVIVSREPNPLLGEMVTEKVVGSAKTIAVYPETCVAKCDSAKTRERAKLGMKVRARGFGFVFPNFFSP